MKRMPELKDLVLNLKLNCIKLVLNQPEDGYELTIYMSTGNPETMFFTYQESHVLEMIDYGILPTALLSGICQSSIRYLYNDYVILEVIDNRDPNKSSSLSYSVVRLPESGIYKLTALNTHRGDIEEEKLIIKSRADPLKLSPGDKIDYNQDAFGFMRSDWFSGLLERRQLNRERRRLIRSDISYQTSSNGGNSHGFLKRQLKTLFKNKPLSNTSISQDWQPPKLEVDPELISKSFQIKPVTLPKTPNPKEFFEESVEEIRVESQTGAVTQLKIFQRNPDREYVGQLRVLNWEGSDSAAVRFNLGREQAMMKFVKQFVNAQTQRTSPKVHFKSRENQTPSMIFNFCSKELLLPPDNRGPGQCQPFVPLTPANPSSVLINHPNPPSTNIPRQPLVRSSVVSNPSSQPSLINTRDYSIQSSNSSQYQMASSNLISTVRKLN